MTIADISPGTWAVVTIGSPEDLPTGSLRRYENLLLHHKAHRDVVSFPLRTHQGPRVFRVVNILLRLLRVIFWPGEINGFHIHGLATPEMVFVAAMLRMSGRPVIFDACDSWAMLADAARNSNKRSKYQWAGKIQRRLLGGCEVSYISERDANADLEAKYAGITSIIPNQATAGLERLAGTGSGATKRFSVSGLYTSPHLEHGLSLLAEAWPQYFLENPTAILDVYGSGTSSFPKLAGSNFRGFAKSLEELYEGATVVLILNSNGSGVPNKMLEAVAALRPMIVHESVAILLEPHPWCLTYRDTLTLRAALQEAQHLLFDEPIEPYIWRK